MLLINKPSGPTSHDIVDEVRRITGERRVGHAGTLDPFAEGLLIVLVGREETRRQAEFLNMDKVYETTFILGEERDTDDLTGKIRVGTAEPLSLEPRSARSSGSLPLPLGLRPRSAGTEPASPPRDSRVQSSAVPKITEIKKTLKKYLGEQEQLPPIYSAKKLKGKKAYELARKGEVPELKPKKVKIYELEILDYKYPELKIRTRVSSGTYIRALARDIGRELGTGAYVSELKRTQIGSYKLENAKTLEELKK